MINLSNRSIDMLRTNNEKWYKGYVLGEWEDEFQTYFAIGSVFAEMVEWYHKTGEWNYDKFATILEQKLLGQVEEDVKNKCMLELQELYNNAKIVITERTESEYQVLTPIDDKYRLKCKYDALWDDYVEDYKTVTNFTKEEEYSKYEQQIKLYQYSEYKRTGKKKKGKITEIKKGKPTLPRKKDELIAMLPDGIDKSGTVEDIKARLYLYTTKEQVSQEIWYEWNDEIVHYIENLLRKAIKKAEWLRSLSYEDVL